MRLGLDLWRLDEPAFTRLFAPDAVAVVRRRDGMRYSSHVLEVHNGRPRAFFRAVNDEFDVLPGDDAPATARAVAFMIEHTGEDAPGSSFTRLDRPGRGFLLDNRQCVHGRTSFVDGERHDEKRDQKCRIDQPLRGGEMRELLGRADPAQSRADGEIRDLLQHESACAHEQRHGTLLESNDAHNRARR